ncbi:hypothetical protein [Nitrobacter sp.]|uniref:hypothetical protein n=1 Tax=Nitrobacter sp. TaxID=29420 RepID=UPI0029CAB632|nr:hypothetical protein [Nitrobacter sp.]
MTYSLKIWTNPRDGEVRLYVNGTPRQALYFKKSTDGRLVWSSKANDTPHRFQTGDHYGKVRKDGAAAAEVAAAYSLELGKGDGQWERALQLATDGIEVGAED